MAKNRDEQMMKVPVSGPDGESTEERYVDVPADVLARIEMRVAAQMIARLEALETADRQRAEAALTPQARVLDQDYEAWKREASRPAKERSQDAADRLFTGPLRFKVRLDSTQPDGKKGPNISEHPELVIAANSDLEAQARYLHLCGIRIREPSYKVITEPTA